MIANEALGPAEKLVQSLITYKDHMVHNRPGVVVPDASSVVGLRWHFATFREQDGVKTVFRLGKQGKKTVETRMGVMRVDGGKTVVMDGNRVVGEYRRPGLFPEIATWLYQGVADIWQLDNEFAARWASFAFKEENRDLKVVLAAFMLVQGRKGDPVLENGKVAFYDDDYRNVGEAMMLSFDRKTDHDFDAKMLLRIHNVLRLPSVAKINRDLGFGKSARRPFEGRWRDTVAKWLRHREENPKILAGLVKGSQRTLVMELAERARYCPVSPKFFEVLRWKQGQAKDGHRKLLIGAAVKQAESWEGYTEVQVCEAITKGKMDWKRVVGLLPKKVGVTRAVMMAAVEAGGMSNKDLLILTPTLEELGLLNVKEVKGRWEKAIRDADDMRAAHIARNVQGKGVQEKLQEAADNAVKKAVKEVMRNLRVYILIDISGSMEKSIEIAKEYLAKFLQAFPPESVHAAVFNTKGTLLTFKKASAAGVTQALAGFRAGGGTDYGAGVRVVSPFPPKEDEDSLIICVGDEDAAEFSKAVQTSGLRPTAFGLLRTDAIGRIVGAKNQAMGAVRQTAQILGIPCFLIEEGTFEDPYAIPQTIRALVAATPVSAPRAAAAPKRQNLAEKIALTPLLTKPVWAS